ncbi:MAG: hypothetical protein QG637_1560 [Chloroflexota bacterium]|nr:hypothetical protein [Chloroflexota bacterium]
MCYNPRVTSQGKVLTGLLERRAIEAAFDALAEAPTPAEMARCAQTVADHGSAVLPVLLARLNTEDPKVRGGLGLVAQRLERELVAPALKAAIRARERSDQARMTALTLLERYLDEPADEGLLGAIQNPSGVARQSLRELIAAMAQSPAAIVEYLTQLAAQPPDAPGLLMQALPGLMPHPHLVTLLRMFAQGEDARLAQQAIELLGRTRTPDALLALISLAVALPPERAAAADRGARKLRFSGVQAAPAVEPAAWQALLSPVDSMGAQAIWFMRRQSETDRPMALSIIMQDPVGILAAAEMGDVAEADLPPIVPEGEILSAPQPGERRPLMLVGASFEAGRQVVYQALKQSWASGHPLPLSYRFLSGMLWQYGAVADDSALQPEAVADLLARHGDLTATLLDHPAFTGWFWRAPALHDAAEKLGTRHARLARATSVAELARLAFGPTDAASYRRRLSAMARWLQLARQPAVAELAQAAAAQLAADPPAETLLVRRLIGIGLDVVALNLRGGFDRRRPA